ncbi:MULTISPECIES: hypothetical protein [unclassified Roseiflexus]|jgi:ribosomal protein S27AE|uniref:hypothetical protein n=1 Tax=unclassified Roseiflexus TaxID=2609473 RepID=UPI0012EECB1C|nr:MULTISPECIES: hypothetical protein [unclassified Roseiflexus]MCL6539236.1 hypothetical protein [Roseiflexus sp.]
MSRNNNSNHTYHCPTCGSTLMQEHDRLRCPEPDCPEHTASLFIPYGPRLVLRAPRADGHTAVTMPWEMPVDKHVAR